MKKLLIISLCLLPAAISAQLKLLNPLLTNQDTAVLFAGIDNRLNIVGSFENGFEATSTNKSKINVENNVVIIHPLFNSGFDTIKISKNKIELFRKVYHIKTFEDPVIELAFTSDTLLAKSRILANPYITVKIPFSAIKATFSIVSYDCFIINKNEEVLSFSGHGSKLTNQIISAIRNMSSGDKILFENIRVVDGTNSNPKFMSSLKIILK